MMFLRVDPDKKATAITFPDSADVREGFGFVLGGEPTSVGTDVFGTGFVLDLWVNTENHVGSDAEFNPVASFLAGQHLLGPAVVASSGDNGETLGLSARDIYALEQACGFTLVDNNGESVLVLLPEKSSEMPTVEEASQ